MRKLVLIIVVVLILLTGCGNSIDNSMIGIRKDVNELNNSYLQKRVEIMTGARLEWRTK